MSPTQSGLAVPEAQDIGADPTARSTRWLDRTAQLRIGVVSPQRGLRGWQRRAVDLLGSLAFTEICLEIIDADHRAANRYKDEPNLSGEQEPSLFVRLGNWLKPEPLRFIGPTERSLGVRRAPFTDDRKALALIRDHAIDCLVWFSTRPVPEALLCAPTYGVWRYCFGDRVGGADRWPCLEEICRETHIVNIRLVVLVSSGGEVLREAVVGTVNRSYRTTLVAATSAASHLLAQACIALRHMGSSSAPTERIVIEHRQKNVHAARQAVFAAAKMLKHRIAWMVRWATISEQWTLGVVDRPIADCLEDDFLQTVRFVVTDKAHYLADGFGWVRDGRHFVLCEQYDYKANRGLIVWLELDSQANIVTGPKPALDIEVHASYPYLFSDEDTMYCCPEAWESGSLALWKAVDPPAVWRRCGELLPGVPAIDPVVFRHDGLWWLLCGREDDQPHEKLYGFYADRLSGPWRSHELNPLKIDVRCARSAGTPFRSGGHLYRPAQDCSRTYGGRISISRVTQLSPSRFVEELVRTIDAPSGTDFPDGIHTITPFGNATLIDAKRWQLSPRGFWLKVRKILA